MEPLMSEEYEEPKRKGDEELPPQLKPLPEGLRYEYLDDSNKYPIIISTDLSEEDKIKIMAILRKHTSSHLGIL
jgi:hypothetical protein